jgi:D-ribose pyranase
LADVLGAVVDQLEVETAYVAEEFATHSPGAYKAASELLARCDLHSVPHAELVKMLPDATLVVRTGECSHNANVVLVGGVTF